MFIVLSSWLLCPIVVIQSFDLNQNVKNVHEKTYKFRRIHYKYIINVFIRHNVTVRYSGYVNPQMTCWSLEFLVGQWLEHPTCVWKVVGSILI